MKKNSNKTSFTNTIIALPLLLVSIFLYYHIVFSEIFSTWKLACLNRAQNVFREMFPGEPVASFSRKTGIYCSETEFLSQTPSFIYFSFALMLIMVLLLWAPTLISLVRHKRIKT
jgi:hypothetical protein